MNLQPLDPSKPKEWSLINDDIEGNGVIGSQWHTLAANTKNTITTSGFAILADFEVDRDLTSKSNCQ